MIQKSLKRNFNLTAFLGIGITLIILFFTYYLNLPKNRIITNRPNVLLITMDALRPDHLSCYGYKKNTSPHIDDLAREGVTFIQTISQGPATIPSLPSLMTSLYPSQHGVIKMSNPSSILAPTLAQILEKNGFCTNAIVANELKHTGLSKGFDSIYYNFSFRADMVTQKASAWLKENNKTHKSFFLWLHYFEPHEPFLPPLPYSEIFLPEKFKNKNYLATKNNWILTNELPPVSASSEKPKTTPFRADLRQALNGSLSKEDREYYISQYDGEIRFADEQIGEILNELKSLGLYENTIIIFTADHSENLADYGGRFSHGDSLYDILLKIPLIIRYPALPKNKTIRAQVQSIDIMPTILDILKINVNTAIEGKSLLPLIFNKKKKVNDYAFSEMFPIENPDYKSIRTENWKLIYYLGSNKYKLYNLKNDPQELHNLADSEKDEFKFLKTQLEKWMGRTKTTKSNTSGELDEETKLKLKSLGYL